MDVKGFWKAVIEQNEGEIRNFLDPNAVIRWHNTNEQFTSEEFIRANCAYPGTWAGELERVEKIDDLIITVMRIFSKETDVSVHATSFIRVEEDRIVSIDEYWGDDGIAPEWRLDLCLGRAIR